MKKEPLILTLIRWFLLVLFVFFMGMTYWSSLLIEEDLKEMKRQINQSKPSCPNQKNSTILKNSAQPNPEYPNLLTDDPFYKTTLPRLLGVPYSWKGTMRLGMVGKPENLHPFASYVDPSTLNELCIPSLAKGHFGVFEKLAPNLAEKMELRTTEVGEPIFWIFLRQDIFWNPLKPEFFSNSIKLSPHFLKNHPVTAHDVKFYFDAFMNPNVQESLAITLRLFYNDVKELKVIDDYTITVQWKTKEEQDSEGKTVYWMKYQAKNFTANLKPLASFLFKYFPDGSKIIEKDSDPDIYRTNPVWAQNFNQHWAKNIIPSCGPWVFNGFTERNIQLKRNADFYDPYAALVADREYSIKNTPDAIWDGFKAGQIDYLNIAPHQLSELERFMHSNLYEGQAKEGKAIRHLDYIYRAYTYIGWNLNKNLFKSEKVRQAMTYAIDRERIIKQLLNGKGEQITGPFFPLSPSYDSSLPPYPFDPHKARELLKEEGWADTDGDGIIDKIFDGKKTPFKFTLTYFVKNPTTKAICEYVATSFKEIGIACQLNGVDTADLSAIMNDRSFDAYFMGWALSDPPEEPKQLWYSAGKNEKGSSNYVSFANPEADEIIDKLEYEYDREKRLELYHRLHKIIYDEQPYTFMYVPKMTMAYREYVQNVFLPVDRQDLVPGANVAEPQPSIFWLKQE